DQELFQALQSLRPAERFHVALGQSFPDERSFGRPFPGRSPEPLLLTGRFPALRLRERSLHDDRLADAADPAVDLEQPLRLVILTPAPGGAGRQQAGFVIGWPDAQANSQV